MVKPTHAHSGIHSGPTCSLRDRLVDLSAALLVVPALLPLVVVFTRSLYFDVDPRSLRTLGGSIISIEIGPAGSAWLAAAAVFIAGWVMMVAVWAGAKVRWGSVALAGAGVIPCLIHMPSHFDNRLHGGAWIAAVMLGLAAAHIGQFVRAKRLILTAMIAVALPLFIQAVWYVYVDHPETVRTFMETERQSVEARGLVYGSAEHAKYLTRLGGQDVIGAVGMSNVLGSLVAAITVLGGVWVVGGWRRGTGWLRAAGLAGVVVMGGWTLVLTQSKGALLAFAATIGLGACALFLTWLKTNRRRLLPALCVAMVLAGSAAVLVRGAIGPPDGPEGERSLLFRFHYWQGAVRILADEPARITWGVGPGRFKDAYEAVRNPISPEVVASTHNVFVDYAVMLGVGGVAWGMLLLVWLWQSGWVVSACSEGLMTRDRAPPTAPPVRLFAMLAAVVFGIQLFVQYPGLYAPTAILWLVGTLGFVALSAWVIYPMLSDEPGEPRERGKPGAPAWVDLAAMLAAVLLLLHSQIEMTFFWDSAAAFAWVMVGVASARYCNQKNITEGKPSVTRYAPAVCLLVLGVVISITNAWPVTRHQARLADAAQTLRQAGPPAALIEMDRAAEVIGNDPMTVRWQVRLREEIAAALNVNGRADKAEAFVGEAMGVLDRAERAGLTGLGAARRRGSLAMGAYQILGDSSWLTRAQTAYQRAVELSPNSLNDHVRLADARWQLGEFDAAQAVYRRALKISEGYYLDPDIQLTESERKRIEVRLVDGNTAR